MRLRYLSNDARLKMSLEDDKAIVIIMTSLSLNVIMDCGINKVVREVSIRQRYDNIDIKVIMTSVALITKCEKQLCVGVWKNQHCVGVLKNNTTSKCGKTTRRRSVEKQHGVKVWKNNTASKCGKQHGVEVWKNNTASKCGKQHCVVVWKKQHCVGDLTLTTGVS